MRIRTATAADIEAIARLHAESWRTTYRGQYGESFLDGPVYDDRLREWRERLTSPTGNQQVIVAEDVVGVAGFACAFSDDDARWGTLLDNLHVEPARKRSGIGTRLIREIALLAREDENSQHLYLWVLEANGPARRFYERLGAANVERRAFEPPGGGTSITLRYAWDDVAALIAAADAAQARAGADA
jgi:GNAT superfamily N-acetyltransferase